MRKLLALLLVIAPLWAQAAPPEELKKVFQSTAPYGEAEMSYLLLDVYHIALWTDQAVWSPNSPFALSITYAMGFSSDELWGRTCDEMQRHALDGEKLCLATQKTNAAAMPDVKKGDRITALRTAKGTTRFYKNGALTGEVATPQFSNSFFAIWLGENTSEPALRRKLLGKP